MSARSLAAIAPVVSGDPEFRATVELLLFGLGAVMTLGVLCFLIWLIRQMLREDREAAAAERQEGE